MPGSHHSDPDHGPTIAVGYDGSAESRAALELAAHTAGPLGKVFVVVCFEEPARWLGGPEAQAALDRSQSQARELVHDLERQDIPGLRNTRWEAELLPAPAAEAIVRVADVRDADEIVVGSRGRGKSAAVLGSVSHEIVHLADRPVRVITKKAAERIARRPVPAP